MEDPVLTAEWAAGQVLTALEDSATSKGISSADAEERNEFYGQADTPLLVDMRAASPSVRDFVVNHRLIEALKGFVDYEAGPSEIEITRR